MNMLQAMQSALTTNDTFVTYDYNNVTTEGEQNAQYQLPSYQSLINRIKALETSLQSIASGKAQLAMNDGSRRNLKLQNLPHTPQRIRDVPNPTTFDLDTNWFFEDLMFPGVTVKVDLTGKIEDSSDRVKITRVILDANDEDAQKMWQNNLATNNYDYASLKALLAYNGVGYYEDVQEVSLPLVSNTLYGEFQITDDPIIKDGNTWYLLNTLNYQTIDGNGVSMGANNILSINDMLAYQDTLFQVIDIQHSQNMVRLKVLNGTAFPGVFSVFHLYQDPFRDKTINVRFGAKEYDIIYVKGVDEDYNLLGNEWSDPIKFSTDDLVYSNDVNVKF